jgi:hypothetical protein
MPTEIDKPVTNGARFKFNVQLNGKTEYFIVLMNSITFSVVLNKLTLYMVLWWASVIRL